MKVVITGGPGFIGLNLARRLVLGGALTGPSGAAEEIDSIVLFDLDAPVSAAPPAPVDARARTASPLPDARMMIPLRQMSAYGY